MPIVLVLGELRLENHDWGQPGLQIDQQSLTSLQIWPSWQKYIRPSGAVWDRVSIGIGTLGTGFCHTQKGMHRYSGVRRWFALGDTWNFKQKLTWPTRLWFQANFCLYIFCHLKSSPGTERLTWYWARVTPSCSPMTLELRASLG